MTELSVRTMPDNGDDAVGMAISGPMTIQYAGELRERLLELFGDTDRVKLDLSGVTEIDVAGLQLLCSAHRTSIATNKSFVIAVEPKSVVWKAAQLAGQLRQTGCVEDVCHTCVWTGGST